MPSKKRNARQRQQEAFEAQLGGLDDVFARAERESAAAEVRREAAYRTKSCSSKNRYDTRQDARAAIASCEAHGRRGLSCYRCEFCGGWHLTSHPR